MSESRLELKPVPCNDMIVVMNETKVPGFRPGKRVPENIIVGFVGRPYVLRATVESILKRTLPHAMESVSNSFIYLLLDLCFYFL